MKGVKFYSVFISLPVLKENLSSMVPFVGSGLTSFVYGTWPGALKKLAKKLTNAKSQKIVYSLIEKGELEKAAQRLEEFRSPANLSRDIANYFSPDNFNKKRNMLKQEPIYLLPLLFPGLVLTTNFDAGLEITYREWNREFREILHPGHSEILGQLLRQTADGNLFKFHGSVSGRSIEYGKIVFTDEQYKQYYGDGTSLVRDLKSCLERKVLFFLGCSLKNDRTMEVLQSVLEQGDYCEYYHYTIINCKRSEREEKILDLGKKHIRAVLYEDNRHEAVKVILEHLLKEVMPESYENMLFRTNQPELSKLTGTLGLNEELIPFYGRRNEMEELNSFLDDQGILFRWWAITGPGGSGKSRLAYEFQKQLPRDWDICRLTHADCSDLSKLSARFMRKTLVIADYIEEHVQALGAWMEELAQKENGFPLRILLVGREIEGVSEKKDWNLSFHFGLSERQDMGDVRETPLSLMPEEQQDDTSYLPFLLAGQASGKFSWEQQLYMNIRNRQVIKKACFRQTYLELKPLSDHALLNIIKDCSHLFKKSNSLSRSVPNAQARTELLQKLKAVDPTLCRPLYAIFLTDAYMNGNEPRQWSREIILDYMIEREHERLEFGICEVMGLKSTDRKLLAACQYLQCISTVLQGVPAGKLQDLCFDVWEVILKKAENFESPMDLLHNLGLMDRDVMLALRPDLIGEYYVYDWMGRQRKETVHSFLSAVWKAPRPTVIFFDQILNDYGYLLNASAENWDMLLLENIPQSINSAILYSMFLLNTIHHCNLPAQCEKHICQLEALADSYSDVSEIMIAYAYGMTNLIIKQEEKRAQETVRCLRELVADHPHISELAIALAKGMINLGDKKDISNPQEIVERLESLADKYSDEQEIVGCFADSLVQLGNKLFGQAALENLKKLEALAEKYPDYPKVTVMLSTGVYNLTVNVNQDRQIIEQSVKRLEELTISHSDIPDVAILYAQGLFNLGNKQQGQEKVETVKRLDMLVSSYPHIPEIVSEFAKSLVNLSNQSELDERWEVVRRLEQLVSVYPDNSAIVIAFSYGLVNLSHKVELKDAQKAVCKLKGLTARYPDIPELVVSLCNVLCNLSRQQSVTDAQKTLLQLEKFSVTYFNVPDIMVAYAKTLHIVGYKLGNQTDQVDEIGKKLKELAGSHPDIPALMVEYAKFLGTISASGNQQKRQEIIDELKILTSLYAEIPEIENTYVGCLVNLNVRADDCYETVRQLEKLAASYPNTPTVIIAYAKSLYNLCLIQNPEEAQNTVNYLEVLVLSHLNLGDVLICFAHSLMSMSSKQNQSDARKNVERLKNMALHYSRSPEVKDIFDKFYVQLEDIIAKRPQSL